MEVFKKDVLKDYISEKKMELFRKVMVKDTSDAETHYIRGAYKELERLEKELERNFERK